MPESRLTSRLDKVQQDMHTIFREPGVSPNLRLDSKDVVVLPLKVAADLAERSLVVYVVTEAGGIDNGQADTRALVVKLQLNCDVLDADARLAWCALAVDIWRGVVVDVRHDGS